MKLLPVSHPSRSWASGLGLLLLAALGPALADDPKVTATIDPAEIVVGDTAQLTLAVEGAANISGINFTKVDGIEVTGTRQSSQRILSFGMGSDSTNSQSFTMLLAITGRKAGSYTIPPVEVMVGGKKLKSNPVNLRVVNPGGGTVSPLPTPSASAPGMPRHPPSGPEDVPDLSQQPVLLQVVFPKRDYFVGEVILVEIKLYVRQGVHGEIGPPALSREGFTQFKFSQKPLREDDRVINGETYTVFTWYTAVSAVKAGDLALSAQLEFLVQERRRTHFPFDDSLFDDFFGGTKKRVNIKSKEAGLNVLPLPSEGRPDDFSGAIGDFKMTSAASPDKVAVGDPITVKTTVNGLGNFDRVNAPAMESSDGWKTYSPTAKFEATDEIGFSGSKTFEQAMVPQRADLKQLPGLKFSYFDPIARKYVTHTTPPVKVQVSPGSGLAVAPVPSLPSPLRTASSQPSTGPEELVPNKVEIGSLAKSISPLVFQPWFLGMQLAPLALVLVAWAVARRREQLERDPSLARSLSASRAVRAQLEAMEAALRQQDAQAFFTAARRALQERLGERLGQESQAITMSEVEHRLGDSPLLAEVRRIFEIADSVAYSGQTFSAETLGEWRQTVLDAVRKLEKKR